MSDDDISNASAKLYAEANQPKKESSVGGPVLTAAARSVPTLASTARTFAQNPNVPKAAASIGRILGGLAPIVGGAEAAGVPGAMMGVAGAAKGSWAGGKTGYFTGKLLQRTAAPLATVLEKAAPFAETASRAIGPQNFLDLAQMAEPNRRDIGVLGIGSGTPDPAHPALINDYAAKLRDYVMGKLRHGQ